MNPKPLDVKLAKHLHAIGVNAAHKMGGGERVKWKRLPPPLITAWLAVAAEVRKTVKEATKKNKS